MFQCSFHGSLLPTFKVSISSVVHVWLSYTRGPEMVLELWIGFTGSYFPLHHSAWEGGEDQWGEVTGENWRDHDRTWTQALCYFSCYLDAKIICLQDHSVVSGGNHTDTSVHIYNSLGILRVELIQMYFSLPLGNRFLKWPF